MVEDVYDQNISTMAFWSLATSPGHVGIQRGKLMWHKIQPGPIRFSTWAEPSNSAFLYFFRVNFWSISWAKPNVLAFFIVGPWPFIIYCFSIFSHYIFKLVPLVRWVPLVMIISQIGPTCQKCTNLTDYFHKWTHWSSFHFTSFQITHT